MTKISDADCLPAFIDATWDAYQHASGAQKDQLASRLQELHNQLTDLADTTLDPAQQDYRDAVSVIQNATGQIAAAQAAQEKVVKAIATAAQVIAALGKAASLAAMVF